MRETYLFVYGTLWRDSGSEMVRLLISHGECIGDATFQGKFYRIGSYPGVAPSDDRSDLVRGEVYRLRDPGLVLARLDQYEECVPGSPEPAEFVRKMEEVRLGSGKTIRAWVYLYNRPTAHLEWIPGGDFLESNGGNTGGQHGVGPCQPAEMLGILV